MKNLTKTTNRLHFSDLDPLRFEDLCLNLVSRLEMWKELNHFGRKGSDGCVDIFAIEQQTEVCKKWIIQCKRYATLTNQTLKKLLIK